MTSEIFVDVIGSMSVEAGLVRIELTARQAADGEATERMVPRQRVIMPIEGVLAAMGAMTELAAKLGAARPAGPSPVIMAETTSPQSPNFR